MPPSSRHPHCSLIDINNNGVIEMDEFVTSCLVMGGFTYAQLAEAFKRIDLDHNGQISREEFKTVRDDFPNGYARVRVRSARYTRPSALEVCTWSRRNYLSTH